MKKPSETALVKVCLDYLRLRGLMVWRANSGAMTVGEGPRKRFVRFNGAPGCADILGILPGGRFLAIEVKMPARKPTLKQDAFLGAVADAGGAAWCVHSLEELQAFLAQI